MATVQCNKHEKDLYHGNGPGRAGSITQRLSLLESFEDDMEKVAKKLDRIVWLLITTLITAVGALLMMAVKGR